MACLDKSGLLDKGIPIESTNSPEDDEGIENVMKKVLGNVRLWWKFRKMNLERRKRNLERRRDNAGRTGGRREFEGERERG